MKYNVYQWGECPLAVKVIEVISDILLTVSLLTPNNVKKLQTKSLKDDSAK